MFVRNAIYFLQNRFMSCWYIELAGAMALSALNRKNTPAVGIAKIPTMLGPTFVLGRGMSVLIGISRSPSVVHRPT